MHSTNQSYEIEWVDKENYLNTLTIWARSASQAEKKAKTHLSRNSKFDHIEAVELYP